MNRIQSLLKAALGRGATTVVVVALLVVSVSAGAALIANDPFRDDRSQPDGVPVDDNPSADDLADDNGGDRAADAPDDNPSASDLADDVSTAGAIDVQVVGAISPGATVTVIAIHDGAGVSGADVFVKNGAGDRMHVGTTDADGRIDVTVPATGEKAGKLNVKVRSGSLEGEFEFEPAESGERVGTIDITVDGDITPGATVTVTATQDGEALSGAQVYVKDGTGERQLVGQTDENGQFDVTVPAEGDKAGDLNVKVRMGELEGEFEFEPSNSGR